MYNKGDRKDSVHAAVSAGGFGNVRKTKAGMWRGPRPQGVILLELEALEGNHTRREEEDVGSQECCSVFCLPLYCTEQKFKYIRESK
jgi:hypothetical protein